MAEFLGLNFNQWNEITSSIQAVTVSLGLIVGGVWAYRKFGLMDEINKSRLEKSKFELENSVFRRKLNEFPAVNITTSSRQIGFQHDNGFYVAIDVNMQNVGEASVKMVFSEDSFGISKIKFDENGNPNFEKELIFSMPSSDKPNIPIRALVLRSGDVTSLSTIVKLQEAGLYFVRFYALQSKEQQTLVNEKFGETPSEVRRPLRWGESTIVAIDRKT